MLKRISITGPECTGKTWLAKRLSSYYKGVWVPEYSVEYLSKKGEKYTLDDITSIARGQLEKELIAEKKSTEYLFADTDLLVNLVWSKVVFNEVPEWIEKMVDKHVYDLYLLCYPDIEWQEGPFRENPAGRRELFDVYLEEIQKHQFRYAIIKGKGARRFENAVKFVNEIT